MNAAAITIPYVVVKENEATYERLRANYSQPEIIHSLRVGWRNMCEFDFFENHQFHVIY
jgi:hypothetical protein